MIQDVVSTLPSWWSGWVLPIGAGICLSAATGFRTFVPLLCVGLAAHFGLFNLDAQYAWLASTTGLVALGTAAVLEVGGYYIPVVDNLLDVIATPLSMVAGTLVMFTSIGADHGVPGWLLAMLVGGGVSGLVQLTTVKTRALSTGTTAGLANPVVATAELLSAAGLSALALLLPVIAVIFAALVITLLWVAVRRLRRPRVAPAARAG
jgi:Domain of unknown function (DUF4126)